MGFVNSFYLLTYNDYSVLLSLKEEAQKEYEAMGNVVLTANMNARILMSEVLNKKKRAIARIDASETGKIFLKTLIEKEDVSSLDTVINRIQVGSLLHKKRKKFNTELVDFQRQSKTLGLTDLDFKISIIRFLKNKINYFIEMNSLQIRDEDYKNDYLVNEILVEEITWLIEEIKTVKPV